MKNIILFLFVTISFFSCKEVVFKNPQPKGMDNIQSFPANLQGYYITKDDRSDTLKISENSITIVNDKKTSMNIMLCDTALLRQNKKYYFINLREGEYWYTYVLKLKKNKFDMLYLFEDTTKNNIKKISEITKIEKNEDSSHYVIDPTKKELMKILKKGCFSNVGTFYKVKNK